MSRRATPIINPYSIKDLSVRQAFIAVKDAIDRLEGASTDPSLKNIRVQDLLDFEILKVDSNGKGYSAANPTVADIVPSIATNLFVEGRDTTAPTASWSAAVYEGHSYTEIYSSATDDIDTSSLVGTSTGSSQRVTSVGDVSADLFFWIRHVNIYGKFGPYNATDGTNWVVSSSGSGTPSNPDKSIQFNDGGVFGGEAGFEYDKATDTQTVGKIVVANESIAYSNVDLNKRVAMAY